MNYRWQGISLVCEQPDHPNQVDRFTYATLVNGELPSHFENFLGHLASPVPRQCPVDVKYNNRPGNTISHGEALRLLHSNLTRLGSPELYPNAVEQLGNHGVYAMANFQTHNKVVLRSTL